MRYAFGSLQSVIQPEDADMIESGVAYIKRDSDDPRPQAVGLVAMEEPIALASIIMEFAKDPASWMVELSSHAMNNVELGYRLELELALLIMHHFGGKYTELGHVFTVGASEAWPELEHKKFTLVGIVKRDGVSRSFSSSWKKAPALPFGYRANDAGGFASALESGHGFSFFFPDNNARPDFLTVLREEETGLTTVLLAQAKFTHGKFRVKAGENVVDRATFFSAVDSVDPHRMYAQTNKVRHDHIGKILPRTDSSPDGIVWRDIHRNQRDKGQGLCGLGQNAGFRAR